MSVEKVVINGINNCIPKKLTEYLIILLGEDNEEDEEKVTKDLKKFAADILEYSSIIKNTENICELRRIATFGPNLRKKIENRKHRR